MITGHLTISATVNMVKFKECENKRIAELQQITGHLTLGVSKIEKCCTCRANLFGPPICFIYTVILIRAIKTQHFEVLCIVV